MKKILISMLAVAALVSCSKEESIRVDQGEAIEFGNAFVDNATRADDPSYSTNNIEKFNVYGTVNGVVIYPGTEITKGTAAYGAAWTCPVDQYWISGANYKFVGIVDGNVKDVTTTNLVDGMPATIDYVADGKTDLLCQTITKTAKTDGTANGLVAFNFNHLLSKVNFTVNNDSTEATTYNFVVRDINFNGATAATYNVETATWGTATATGDKNLGNLTVPGGTASVELTDEVLFIPGEYTITFTVDIYAGAVSEANRVVSTPYAGSKHTLEAANAYNFNVGVSVGEKIQFSVEKQPTWTPNTDITLQ